MIVMRENDEKLYLMLGDFQILLAFQQNHISLQSQEYKEPSHDTDKFDEMKFQQ
jgi:hypothetical protein